MLKRISTGEDAGVRTERGHRMRVRKPEPHALGRPPIERRRRRRPAVTTQRIGAQRVDGDEENVLMRDRMEISFGRPALARCEEPYINHEDTKDTKTHEAIFCKSNVS